MSILKKIDSTFKNAKTFVATGSFVAINGLLASFGYDLMPLVESAEQAYLAVNALFVAVITLLRTADLVSKEGE